MKKNHFLLYILLLQIIILSSIPSNTFSQEFVVIRSDCDIYISGETVWVTINCLEIQSSKPSEVSKVVYIELINRNNAPVYQMKCLLDNGQATLKIALPDTLSTDNYLLRSYTKWMRNYHEQFYAKKTISILNPFVSNSLPKSENYFSTDTIIIYPEGGKLLNGVENKILLRSINKYGKPLPLNGIIASFAKDTIGEFRTDENGFGTFTFRVEPFEKYKILIENEKLVSKFYLPKGKSNGCNLRVISEDDKEIRLKIFSTSNNYKNLKVDLSTINGKFLKSYNRFNDQHIVAIPKDSILKGILLATLLDDRKVLSSRPLAIQNKSGCDALRIELNKSKFRTREKVVLSINKNLKHELKNITVSVTKKDLLHTSFLASNLSRADFSNYHFLEQGQKKINAYQDLLLMIDHSNHSILKQANDLFLNETKGEIISGKITDKNTGKPIANIRLVLNFVSKSPTFNLSKTDSLGQFRFIVNQFGKKEMVIQPLDIDSTSINYKIELDHSYSDDYAEVPIRRLALERSKVEQINEAIINTQVNTFYNQYKKITKNTSSVISPLPFYEKSEKSIIIDKYIELPNIEEIINEIVPNTFVRYQKGNYQFKVSEDKSLYPKQGKTSTFIDGVFINNINELMQIDPKELEKVEVINLNYFIEDVELGRLLFFYTVDCNMGDMSFDKRIFRQLRQCYSYDHNFEGPNYDKIDNKNSKLADFRNLLHYQIIDSIGNSGTKISFYTADESTDYTIIVEGIRPDGSIERVSLPLKVEGSRDVK